MLFLYFKVFYGNSASYSVGFLPEGKKEKKMKEEKEREQRNGMERREEEKKEKRKKDIQNSSLYFLCQEYLGIFLP